MALKSFAPRPGMPRPILLAILSGFLLNSISGCLNSLEDRDQVINAPPGTSSPIIQGLLDPRATVQSLWIEWSIPSDSSWGGESRPIDPGLVNLRIVGPDGVPVHLAPGAPGQFAAILQVMPDSLYRLEGTIAATPVSARVRVPDSVQITSPATDTVRIAREGLHVALPYEFTADGATVFVLVDPRLGPYRLTSRKGVVDVFALEDTIQLILDAYEPYGGEWSRDFTEHPSASNIIGAYGFFGAFVQSRPIIVIPQ